MAYVLNYDFLRRRALMIKQALLFGLSLRHGWGVAATTENEQRGFTWLQRAAETVVADLDQAVQDGHLSGTEQEQAAQAAKVRLIERACFLLIL
jgi:hypothetical protein